MNVTQETATPPDANTITATISEGERRERKLAEVGLSSVVCNANTAKAFAIVDGLDVMECISVYEEKAAAVKSGDLSGVEAILTAQAITLDTIFNKLACRAAVNIGEHLGATESYLRLALKAQAQCAKTIETLGNIKNPSTVSFVKQANIGQSVQVNNGKLPPNNVTSSRTRTRAENAKNTNELLEVQHGERLDGGTAQASIGVNQNMATVEAVNGRKNSRRKG